MTESILYDTLTKMREQLSAHEDRLKKLEEQNPSSDAITADIEQQVLSMISTCWEQNNKPMIGRVIEQRYGRRLRTVGQTVGNFLTKLDAQGKTKFILSANGAMYAMPRDIYDSLPSEAAQEIMLSGMSDKRRESYRRMSPPSQNELNESAQNLLKRLGKRMEDLPVFDEEPI